MNFDESSHSDDYLQSNKDVRLEVGTVMNSLKFKTVHETLIHGHPRTESYISAQYRTPRVTLYVHLKKTKVIPIHETAKIL